METRRTGLAFGVACCHSDHNVIHLLPKYRSKLKQQAVVTKDIQVWTNNYVKQLQDCFDDTDWDLFFNTGKDMNEITETISAYIQFCEKNVIGTKTIRIFLIIRHGFLKT